MTFSPSEVRSYWISRIPRLNASTHREWRCPCPIHQGTNPNFAINSETGLAQCHSTCGRGWDMISYEMEISGLDFPKAKERVFDVVGRANVPWDERNVEAKYDYTDESGKLLYQVLRYYGKDFKQRRPSDDGGWVWSIKNIEWVPFQLPKVVKADFVGITEGEKDALTLERIGIVGTCNNGGAEKFRPELAKWFAGKSVAIFPDNDDKGRSHALVVAGILSPVAKTVKIVELPNLPLKGDVTDYVNKGGTVEDLRELWKRAQPWTPDWTFASNTPDESDKYVRTLEQEIEIAGGLQRFWDLASFTGMPTPFPKLNRVLGGGMRDGEVYVIGANQGAGKTSLGLQFALKVMSAGYGVLIFSMEMGWRAVFQRMCGIHAGVDLAEYRISQRKGRTNEQDRYALGHATGEIAQWRLLVSTKPAITPEYILSETKRLAKRAPIHFVVVDHMQLMGSEHNVRSDYEKFTSISRATKQTAVEVNVPVLLISQTSRANAKDKRELDVADLRGSGAIEEDAAGVFLLFEDKEDAKNAMAVEDGMRYAKGPLKSFLKIGKNRYGEQGGYLALWHMKGQTRFVLPTDQEGEMEQ